jgi:hypothetical protein
LIAGTEDCETTLITNGSYGGVENVELARESHIYLVTTKMQDRKAADICRLYI